MTKLLKVEGVQAPAMSKKTEKVVTNYIEALQRIQKEVALVKKRKDEAESNIKELKNKLGLSGVDVLTVQDDTKRKDFLGKRKRLKEQLDEEELYLYMDIAAYKQRRIEEEGIEELKAEATKEMQLVKSEAEEYQAELIKQAERSDELVRDMINKSNFNNAQELYKRVTGNGNAHSINMYKVGSTTLVNRQLQYQQPVY